ncbi:hypothetical protein CPB83DRAFT_761746 [Crepidotus variabilis]|uniref:Uncharacterized protein n=1 Tax=Crepidotus variabilis TaxID=179855 RepID=A0A9P6ELF3_9AGAR|nr:hypothetical protein CPB83DRAFT_761746 [Crepidotus variabilis]
MIANPDNSPSRLRPRHLVEPKPSYGSIVPPQTQCLLNIAGEIVDILQENGVDCVLFGGLACTLYGSERVPNDVDLLTFPLPHLDAEDVKKLISEASPGRFHLKPSRNKKATWKILQCILTEQEKLVLSSLSNSCKIDILTPGTKDLPRIPSNRIMYLDTYPVMQFPALLLHKLQAWDDRRKQVGYARQYQKRLLDLEDLDRLFKLGEYVTRLRSSKLWQDRGLFSEQFEEASKIRALELCESYPEFAGRFRSVRLLT